MSMYVSFCGLSASLKLSLMIDHRQPLSPLVRRKNPKPESFWDSGLTNYCTDAELYSLVWGETG